MKKLSICLILISLFVVSFTARVYKLGTTPESLTWDEAALGYNSYSLMQTAKDEYGFTLPLVLRSYDDYKPSLYAYLSIPFIKVFGLSITAIRLLSALAGASLVFSVFLLAFNLFEKVRTAIIASVLTVFAPILLLYSRIALESNLCLALFTAGSAFVIGKKFSKISYAFGLLLLLLSAYAYHSPRYLVPFMVLFSFLIPFDKKILKLKIRFLVPFVLLFIPIIYFVLDKQFNTRFSQTAAVANSGVLFGSLANLADTFSPLAVLSRIYFFALDYIGRYLTYFNPFQLFINSSGHELYHLDGWGIFNPIELPFWLLGVWLFLKNLKRWWPITLIWILAPLPGAQTIDWFSPLRAILLWPFLLVLTAKGINYFLTLKFRFKSLICFTAFGFWIFVAGNIYETVIAFQPYAHFGAYQYGFAQTIPYVKSIEGQYDQVIIDSPHVQPHMFTLFFSQYPPEKYQIETSWRKTDFTKRTNVDFYNYKFREIYWPSDRFVKNTLFVGDIFSLPNEQISSTPNLEFVKDFYTPDGNISFRVVATKP